MTASRVCILVNPKSGDGAGGASRRDRIARALDSAGLEARLIDLPPKRDMHDVVEEALGQGCETVVAAGGDGTISGVADALLKHGPGQRMGILPMGTFNYFARSLGVPLDLDAAVAQLARGETRPVHLGMVNGHAFLNNVSLGIYPSILSTREGVYRRYGRSRIAAHWSTLLTLLGVHRPLRLEAELDGQRSEMRTPLVFVAASAFQLERFNLDGSDAVRDGQFALFAAPSAGRWDLVRAALSLAAGAARRDADFQLSTARDIRLTSSRKRHVVAMDGERRLIRGPIRINWSEHPLDVLAPAE